MVTTVCSEFRTADGVRLAFEDVGSGQVLLWQHGLGADRGQPAEVCPELPGWRRITLECRGHGCSELGDPARLTIAQFADDALALLDHLGVAQAVVGGISLGAGIGLRLAALHPTRVRSLLLARPAWVDAPAGESQAAYVEVAELIERLGVVEGARQFEGSPRLARIEQVAPDNARSLRWFFTRARPDTTVALLSRIPRQWPGFTLVQLQQIGAPTLVIGNDQDDAHPLAHARRLADMLPRARLVQITSKSLDRAAHVAEFRAALAAFVQETLT
ncbi:MAG: hypothetical protein RIQ60_1837 [Pseudomonadota bacterium]|jgi:pimeloyl-ACP methyl ester carboxylesterase